MSSVPYCIRSRAKGEPFQIHVVQLTACMPGCISGLASLNSIDFHCCVADMQSGLGLLSFASSPLVWVAWIQDSRSVLLGLQALERCLDLETSSGNRQTS